MSQIWINSFRTKWGTFRTAATEQGLTLIVLPGESHKGFTGRLKSLGESHPRRGGRMNAEVQNQIEEYLKGTRMDFDLKLDLRGTPFQKRVWRKVAAIPYGRTRTYGEIARALDQPSAARAVGSATGANRLPLVIPCHRVVATEGLGGYSGGLRLKRMLLKLESSKWNHRLPSEGRNKK